MRKSKKSTRTPWFVYMIECKGGQLYTGIAKDVHKRIAQHREGLGSRFLRGRAPLKLRHQERLPDRSGALRREAEIKRMTRTRKLDLIRGG